MEILVVGLLIAVVVGIVVYMKFFKDTEPHYEDREFVMLGIDKKYRQFKKYYTTVNGVVVRSTVDVPNENLRLIEEGITNQITRHNAAFPNWSAHKSLSDYEVLIIDPMCTNEYTEPGSPCIEVNGWHSAGTCIGTYPRTNIKRPKIVVPHQADTNWQFKDYFMRSVWHESEHVREWVNQENEPTGRFYFYANSGDIHPHVP